MKRRAIPFTIAGVLGLLLFFLQAPTAKAQSYCDAVDASGTGTVNWSVAFADCTPVQTLRIPAGMIVVLDEDVSRTGGLEVNGVLDAASEQHSLTITGDRSATLSGSGTLKFYDLIINLYNADEKVTLSNLEVTHSLTVKQGDVTLGASKLANLELWTYARLRLAGAIEVTGDYTSAGILMAYGYRVSFNGGGIQTFTLTRVNGFAEMEVAAGTILEERQSPEYAQVTTLINHGIIRTYRTVAGPGTTVHFGIAGQVGTATVDLDLIKAGGLTEIILERDASSHPTPPSGQTTEAYWHITPVGTNIDLEAIVRLPYNSSQFLHPMACVYGAGAWDCAQDGVSAQQVSRLNVTQSGDWAVFEGTQTTLSLIAGPNPVAANAAATFTATITPLAEGDVQFYVDGAEAGSPQPLVAGSAQYVASGLEFGSHTIKARYLGHSLFLPSEKTLPETLIVKHPAAVTLEASTASPVYGAPVTFDATVSPVDGATGALLGTVSFKVGGVTIADCAALPLDVGNHAQCTIHFLAIGTQSVTAEFTGTGDFADATSVAKSVEVAAAPTAVALSASANPSVYAESVTLTANVTAVAPSTAVPTGTVTFNDLGGPLTDCEDVSLVDGAATCTFTTSDRAGYAITAVYAGNDNFVTATSDALTQVVDRAVTAVGLTASANPSVQGENVTFTANVAAVAPSTAVPTGTVTFKDANGAIAACTTVALVNGQATCAFATTDMHGYDLSAEFAETDTFAAATSDPFGQTVAKAATNVTIIAAPNSSVYGQSVTFTANVTPVSPGAGVPTATLTFKDGTTVIAGCDDVEMDANAAATCTTGGLSRGDHVITAEYSGNDEFNSSNGSLQDGFTVAKANSHIDLTANPSSSVYGEEVTFTAAVAAVAPGAGTPTQTVTFKDGSNTIAGCARLALDASAQATCTTTALGVASHDINVEYSGNDEFNSTTGVIQGGYTVEKADTEVTMTSLPNPSVYGQNVTITATVTVKSPGAGTLSGNVTFYGDGVSLPNCALVSLTDGVAACTVSLLRTGARAVTAGFANDDNFADSTGTLIGGQEVNRNSTTTTLASSPNPSVYGETVFITATVKPVPPGDTLGVQAGGPGTLVKPTGTVTFTIDSVVSATPVAVDADGIAALAIPNLGVGDHTIEATYNGDVNYTLSAAESLVQTVGKADSEVAVSADPVSTVFGESVTFTATVATAAPGSDTPTGSVTFKDGATTITGCSAITLDGTAQAACITAALGVGDHTINVEYGGSEVLNAGSGSLQDGYTVNKADTEVIVSADPVSSVFGQSVTFTATVTAVAPGAGTPTATVTFKDGTTVITGCDAVTLDASAQAVCTTTALNAGSHDISAGYAGNSAFNGNSGSIKGGYTVEKAGTTIGATVAPSPSRYGQPVVITGTVTADAPGSGTPTGSAGFEANGVAIGGCQNLPLTDGQVGCTTKTLAVGANTLRITYAGNNEFESSFIESVSPHMVDPATPVVTITGSPNPSRFTGRVEFTATVSAPSYAEMGVTDTGIATVEPPTGTVAFNIGDRLYTVTLTAGEATVGTTMLDVGSHAVGATYNGDANYVKAASDSYTQTVTKAGTNSSLELAPNPAYKGDTVVFTATVNVQRVGVNVFSQVGPTGTVTFTDPTGTVNLSAALEDGIAVAETDLLPAGAYDVTATYAGNAQFESSTSLATPLVVRKYASQTTLTSDPNPSLVNGWLSFHVEVGDVRVAAVNAQGDLFPSGIVTLTDTTGVISLTGTLDQGYVDLSPTQLVEGTYSVTATYAGDDRYEPSTSAVLVQVVNRHKTKASLTVEPNSILVGDAVALTVNIADREVKALRSGPSGDVQYWVDGMYLGTAQASNGQATLIREPKVAGSFVITASYAGNTMYIPSTADPVTLVVQKRMAGATLTSSPNPSRLSESVVFTATLAEIEPTAASAAPARPLPTGEVVFWTGTAELGRSTLTDGVATLIAAGLDVGTYAMKVTYAGDSAFHPTESSAHTQVVQPLPLAVNDAAGTLEGQPVTAAVLANDKDPVGGGLTVITATQPLSGVVVIDPAAAGRSGATITYTPNQGFAGLDGFSYLVQDANGNTDDGYVAIVVAAQQQNGQPSKVAPVDPTRENHAVFTDTHTSVSLVAPVGIYTGTLSNKDVFYLAYTPIISPTGDINQQPGGMKFGNYVFHLDAFLNGGQLENFQFAQPITLTISYNPLLIGDLQEELLALYYWNGTTWSADGITVVSRDYAGHTITVQIKHLSEFSFFSAPELQRVILPYISNGSQMHTAETGQEAVPAASLPDALPEQPAQPEPSPGN